MFVADTFGACCGIAAFYDVEMRIFVEKINTLAYGDRVGGNVFYILKLYARQRHQVQLDREVNFANHRESIAKQQRVVWQNAACNAILYRHYHIVSLFVLQRIKSLLKRVALDGVDILAKKFESSL